MIFVHGLTKRYINDDFKLCLQKDSQDFQEFVTLSNTSCFNSCRLGTEKHALLSCFTCVAEGNEKRKEDHVV